MHQVRSIAHQHPAFAACRVGVCDRQRPGRTLAGQAQPSRRIGARGLQLALERSGVQLHQGGRALLRQRPHQREGALGLWPVKRQQRQHVRRAKPLVRHALVRLVCGQARRDRGLAIGVAIEAHPDRCARRRLPALGIHGQRSLWRRIAALHLGRETKRGIERGVERRGIDDPRERLDALRPGRKLQAPACPVAPHEHVVHRRHRIARQGIPHLESLQQPARRRVERIGAHVEARCHGRRRRAQVDAQALLAKRQREAGGHRTAPPDADIHRVHGPL